MADRPGPGLSLVGLRGTGKSTVGRIVAARAGRPFADADRVLEEAAGKTIRALFAEEGEAAFRDREERVLDELTRRGGLVLATGGGAVLRATNRRALRRLGPVIWLSAPPQVLADRLRAADLASRPALTARGTLDEIADVLAAREPLYREVADLTIDTAGRTAQEVANLILTAWDRHGGGR